MAIPTTGSIIDSQVYTLRELQETYKDVIEFVYPDSCVHRIFHDHARNALVEEFLATDCDVLWFLDSDITPSKHVLDLVAVHWDKWQVAGAPYPVFMTHSGEAGMQIVFAVYRGSNGKGMAPSVIPYEGTDYVDGIATGCLFIKREIFSKLKKPYFEFKYDEETRCMKEGEDLGFCLKLQKLGIKFFIDYSMVCRHQKSVDLLEMNNYAISYAQKAVNAYDKMFRGQLEEHQARLKAKMTPTSNLSTPKSKLILPQGLR